MTQVQKIKNYGQVVIKKDTLVIENFEFNGTLQELRVTALHWAAERISQAIKELDEPVSFYDLPLPKEPVPK